MGICDEVYWSMYGVFHRVGIVLLDDSKQFIGSQNKSHIGMEVIKVRCKNPRAEIKLLGEFFFYPIAYWVVGLYLIKVHQPAGQFTVLKSTGLLGNSSY